MASKVTSNPRSPLSRRSLLRAGCAALAGSALLAACGKRAVPRGTLPTLRVAIVGKGEGDTRLMLKAAGVSFESYHVEYSNFTSGERVIEALNGGSLDWGGMSEIPPVFAAASPIRSFRQIAVLHGDVNNQAVVVPAGSTLQDLKDLKGRRVGYVRATTTQYFLNRMLESVGLKWSDITPVPMDVADGLAAFSSGKLDAWAIYGYPIQRVRADGARILRTAQGFLSGNYIISAHVDALADPIRSDLITRYLRASRRGYAWTVAHRDAWAQIVSQEIGVPLSEVQDQFRRASDVYELRPVTEAAIASQQGVADAFAKAGLLPGPVDVRPLWDPRFNDIILENA